MASKIIKNIKEEIPEGFSYAIITYDYVQNNTEVTLIKIFDNKEEWIEDIKERAMNPERYYTWIPVEINRKPYELKTDVILYNIPKKDN